MSRRYWYTYAGPLGAETVVGNYALASSTFPPDSCARGGSLCQIYTYGETNPYAINVRLQGYISTAKNTHTFRPNGSGQKPYVYTSPLT